MIFPYLEWLGQWVVDDGDEDGILLSKDCPKNIIKEATEMNADAVEMGNDPIFRFEANP